MELGRLLADVADPDDQLDRLAVAVGPIPALAEAEARLQAVDLHAPGGQAVVEPPVDDQHVRREGNTVQSTIFPSTINSM